MKGPGGSLPALPVQLICDQLTAFAVRSLSHHRLGGSLNTQQPRPLFLGSCMSGPRRDLCLLPPEASAVLLETITSHFWHQSPSPSRDAHDKFRNF